MKAQKTIYGKDTLGKLLNEEWMKPRGDADQCFNFSSTSKLRLKLMA